MTEMIETVAEPRARRVAEGPATTRVVTVEGRTMHLHVHGTAGPAVVALHGIPGDGATFSGLSARLGREARLFAPDLLGFGGSEDAPPGAHAAEHARSVVALLDALDLDRVHLVGFDFGGPIAVLVAAASPQRVASLTLAAANLFPDTPVPGPLGVARVPWLGELFFRIAFSRLGLVMMWAFATGDRVAYPFARFRRLLGSASGVRSTRTIFLASLRELARLYGEVERAARSLRVPATVLWGERDPFFAVTVGERTAEALGASLCLLPGCGHFVPEERPDALTEAVLAHVRRGPA